jgi:ribonuclease-3
MKSTGELSWLSTPSTTTTTAWPPPLPSIKNPSLLEQAFTHRSFISGELAGGAGTENQHYERLEFLGDSYLQSITSQILFSRFPECREGALSEMRQQLVANKPLAYYAHLYNMQLYLRGGKGQIIISDPDHSMKIIADCFEAYIGAIVVDNNPNDIGIKIVEKWLSELFEPRIKEMETQRKGIAPVDKMAKNNLNKLAGGNQCKLEYRWTDGKGGNRGGYWITVFLNGWGFKEKALASGWGSTKK